MCLRLLYLVISDLMFEALYVSNMSEYLCLRNCKLRFSMYLIQQRIHNKSMLSSCQSRPEDHLSFEYQLSYLEYMVNCLV